MHIFLIGMPGSGKTSFGKRLAKALDCPFVDLDARLAEAEAMPVAEIFRQKGETYFRHAESETLKNTLSLPPSVVATGGGTPCFFDNMDWMNQHGATVFLDVPLDELARRLTATDEAQRKRPLFAGQSPEQLAASLSQMHQNRLPFYEKARFRLLPSETKPAEVAARLGLPQPPPKEGAAPIPGPSPEGGRG
jgi:shikimate kinase